MQNNSNVPIDFKVYKIQAASNNVPTIVEPTLYTDEEWADLTREETESKLALGIMKDDTEYWLNNTFSVPSNTTVEIEPCAKFGLDWSENRDGMLYDINLLINLHR